MTTGDMAAGVLARLARWPAIVPGVAGTNLYRRRRPAIRCECRYSRPRPGVDNRSTDDCPCTICGSRRRRRILGAVAEQASEVGELGGTEIRDGPERHAILGPVEHGMATIAPYAIIGLTRCCRRTGRGIRPDEQVDDVVAPPVDQCRHGAPIEIVQAAACQREIPPRQGRASAARSRAGRRTRASPCGGRRRRRPPAGRGRAATGHAPPPPPAAARRRPHLPAPMRGGTTRTTMAARPAASASPGSLACHGQGQRRRAAAGGAAPTAAAATRSGRCSQSGAVTAGTSGAQAGPAASTIASTRPRSRSGARWRTPSRRSASRPARRSAKAAAQAGQPRRCASQRSTFAASSSPSARACSSISIPAQRASSWLPLIAPSLPHWPPGGAKPRRTSVAPGPGAT